jgi:Zn-finger nucleic acid-binding protein
MIGRGAFITCPACRGPMNELRLEPDISVDVCVACRGVWFDWFDGETSALAHKLDTDPAQAPGSVVGNCPRDGTPLEPHAYLDVGPTVQRCPTCLGLFAPRSQIEPLQRFHERMPEKAHEPIERSSLLSRLWHAFVG